VTGPAEFVRSIRRGETLADLLEEIKALVWTSALEHAVVKLAGGRRVLVKGGPGGIDFLVNQDETEVYMMMESARARIVRIYFHTHPRVTGPSDDDLRFLHILGQRRARIFEIGGDPQGTLLRPKRGRP